MANFEPKPFGKYFLTDRIAIGGMAEIYKAKTFGVDGFEKVMAIKKILTHYSSDKEFITMLTDEAKLVVNLSHANIVQVYDLGRVGDDYFISMEFIDGKNLRDLIDKVMELGESIPPEIIIYVAAEVCKGLDYAHNKRDQNGNPLQIVHRDISPQNILVSYDGGVKIVDFGIAKAAMNLSTTNIGILKGKVTYMSPEQAFGKPIDGRTDLFSLGIVLYELFTKKRLYTGESQMQILKKIRNTKVTVDSLGKAFPPHIKPVVAKALSYTAKERYQSAADMQIELTRILYTHYPEFSPRKLSDLMHNWFKKDLNGKKEPEKPVQDKVLVSSSTNQVNIVHREESKADHAVDQILEDTIKPEDQITKNQLKHGEPDLTEKTEKSDVTDAKNNVDIVAQKKPGSSTIRARLFLSVFVLIAIYILLTKFGVLFPQKSPSQDFKIVDSKSLPEKVTVLTTGLTIESNPPGAKIFLNDSDTELTTPAQIKELEYNKDYTIKLVLDGYQPNESQIKITEDLPKSLSINLEKAKISTYTLKLNSDPAGATIYLDDQDTKKQTPATLDNLEIGNDYKIILKKDKYKSFEQVYSSKKSHDQSLDVKLAALPAATLKITSNPSGAAIFIDSQKTKFVTPYEFKDLEFPKKMTIVLQKEGYEDVNKIIDLSQAKNYDIQSNLIAKVVSIPVTITSNVKGAEVIINNKSLGNTPLDVDLTIGKHSILLKKSTYISQSKTLTLSKTDKKQSLYFKLSKQESTTIATPPPPTTTTPISLPQPTNIQSSANMAVYGKLRIDSTPRGASVKVNGIARGVTPIVVSNLQKNQSLSVTVSKKGYQTWSRSLTLKRDWTETNAVLTRL